MKSAVYYSVVMSLALVSTAYAQGTCATGGNPGGGGPVAPCESGAVNPLDPFNDPAINQPAVSPAPRPSATRSNIRVIDAGTPVKTPAKAAKLPAESRITVVTEDLPRASSDETVPDTKPAEPTNEELSAGAATSPQAADDVLLSDALKALVGTWKTVARRDGELTTIQLRLDDRGWAELTIPDAEGKPSTFKRRARLHGEKLDLTESELLLGQLLEVNRRQMVLAHAGGQVTFVRQ